jgi:ribosome-associated protein
MDHSVRVSPAIEVPGSELSWRFSRSSGPGGQSVNTTDSRVELMFNVETTSALPEHLRERALNRLAPRLVDGVLTITASEYRSQLQNRRAAIARLAVVLADAIAPPAQARKATRPSRGRVQARLDAKKRRGDIKRQRRSPDY